MKRTVLIFFKCCLLSLFFLSSGFKVKGQETFYNIDSIQEIRISFQQSNWRYLLDSLFQNFGEEGRLDASVSINGEVFPHSGVRFKGYSSYDESQIKNPFNIDLDYTYSYQNYQGFTKIKLSNVIHDPSFVREVLSYEIARQYMPASRANFAKVYVNDTLIGLYTNVEAVDKRFVKRHFGTDDNTFFKGSPESLVYPFGENSNLALSHGSNVVGYLPYYKLESIKGWEDIYNLIYVLNEDSSRIDDVLNVDRALWMHAFNYALLNLDSYIGYSQNYYMYATENGQFNSILWDLNMSFGSFRYSDATALNLSINKIKQLNPLQHLYSPAYSPRPLMKVLFSNNTHRRMYLAHLRTIMDEQIANGHYLLSAQQLQSSIDIAVQEDTNKFYSYADFLLNIDTTTGPASDQYPGIKDLMEARMAYLDTFPGIAGAPTLSLCDLSPEQPIQNSPCIFQSKIQDASIVYLFYRTNSKATFKQIQLFDDGAHADENAGDSVFGNEVIINGNILQYYFYAENDSAGRFLPERAAYEVFTAYPRLVNGDIVLNELYTNNQNNTDQDGDSDAWLELYNNTNETICLKDIVLHDSMGNVLLVMPDTLLGSKSFLIVWLDGEPGQSGLHTQLGVDPSGCIYMGYEGLATIDTLAYGFQHSQMSFGSYPNGSDHSVFLTPSFANSNQPAMMNGDMFSLFPNPCNDLVYIEYAEPVQVESIEIFNSQLQCVMKIEMPFGTSQTDDGMVEIEVSKLRQGIYFIELQCDQERMMKKLMVVR